MIKYEVDLTNCDREPIHIPGKVQSHGMLAAVNEKTYQISYISENSSLFAKQEAKYFLGKDIAELENALQISGPKDQFIQLLNLGKTGKSFEAINPYQVELSGEPYYLIITPSGDNIIFEFEPADSDLHVDLQKTIGRSVTEILAGKNLEALLNNAAGQVKKVIKYDRVMIYKFNEDGHGEVVAEVKNDDLEPFLGLHYPASDIPKQARELYKINLTRIIADVNKESSPIITYNATADAPLDLTHSVLRAVSPIHIQYLKNMGVFSSFSISLIDKGELWGLIACHNYSPRFINYKARDAARLIGQILSSALEYRQEEENTEKLTLLNNAAAEIIDCLKTESNIIGALTKNRVKIQEITNAAGAAVYYDNNLVTTGTTPAKEDIADLIKWLRSSMHDSVYYTHRLPEIFSSAKKSAQTASGILACRISKELGEFIIWFKPEQLDAIKWAGNPEKPVEKTEDGLMFLSPRKSFEQWTQIVKNTSEKWSHEEITTVLRVREEIIYTINRKANEIRLLNERLQLAYEELDTFSYTISHDLRTPLSSIKSYSELLLSTNKSLDDQARKILQRIIAGTDKMSFLIKEILHYSGVGRQEIEFNKIDMTLLVEEISREVTMALKPQNLELILGDLPPVHGDHAMINQVFTNLMNNAIKYSAKSNPQKIEIKGVIDGDNTVYSIADNGVGIDVNYYSRVFELFKRMDNVKDFEGTGVGLAIVKRIVEKHNARIWFESQLGVGTVFYISFRNL